MERFNSELFLTTTQVADLLDVHPSSVKRWCNDGELSVDKTEGGHRRIHLQEALELARVRGIDTYLAPFSPYEGHVWTAVRRVVDDGAFDRVHSLAMGWLARGHLRRLARLYLELGRHPDVDFAAFCDEGIRGFMRQIGDAWREGRLRVGEEHMASEALVETLLGLRSVGDGDATLERGDSMPAAIVGAMEGDRHHLGALCVRLLLERKGWRVYFLGADVPVEDFSAVQRSRGADLVCISFAPPNTGADMKRCVRILGEFYDPAHPFALALGGDVEQAPVLDDMTLPFDELEIFDSIRAFEGRLGEGFAAPSAAASRG